MALMGQYFKNLMDDYCIYWPRKNNLQLLFLGNLFKIALLTCGEYAKRRKKYYIKWSISG
jgi:hypothetical protein